MANLAWQDDDVWGPARALSQKMPKQIVRPTPTFRLRGPSKPGCFLDTPESSLYEAKKITPQKEGPGWQRKLRRRDASCKDRRRSLDARRRSSSPLLIQSRLGDHENMLVDVDQLKK